MSSKGDAALPQIEPDSRGLVARGRALAVATLQHRTVRSIGVLVGGTATAHLITALALPVSTRLFTPADFTVAAAFSSLVAILSVASCLRFDVAIALPESDAEAATLLVIATLAAAGSAGAVALAIALLPASALALINQPRLLPLLWLLPIGVFIGGLYLALQMWFARRRAFGRVALSRVAQSASAAGSQIGLGLMHQAPLGLLVGQLMNYGIGSIWLSTTTLMRDRALLRQVTLAGMRGSFSRYRRFPIYSTWEAMANAASSQAPILLIAALALGPEAGYLALAIFLLQAPMALLGNAVGQVYVSGAGAAQREGRLADYTRETISGLVRVAAAPLGFLAVASPAAFGLVFGDGWERAGLLVTWMVPWFFAQFIAVPVSTALHVTDHQRAAMILQVLGLVVRVGAVLLASVLVPVAITEAYAVSGALVYAAYLIVVLKAVDLPWRSLAPAGLTAMGLACIGVAGGTIVASALAYQS